VKYLIGERGKDFNTQVEKKFNFQLQEAMD